MWHAFRLLVRCVGLLTVTFAAVESTLVPRLTLEQLTAASEYVVVGQVDRSWSAWDAAHQFIWTHYELEVRERWKTEALAATRIVVSEPGGTVNGVTMRIAGALPFESGEEVLLFLYRTPVGYLRATGGGQGKYTIERTDSGEGRVRANLAQVELAEPARNAATGAISATRLETFDGQRLSEFKTKLLRLMERQAQKARQ